MQFNENRYLDWYIPKAHRPDPPINLHSSGVDPFDPQTIPPAIGDPWGFVDRFETALATWLSIPSREICFTPGATGGNLLALLTFSNAAPDEVLVESPIYEPMLKQAQRLCTVRRFKRRAESGWQLSLDEIEQQLSEKTRLVLITEPSNPSGTFYSREEILQIAGRANRVGAILLINEVYRGFTNAPSFHKAAENIVVLSSLSKLFGTYSLRLGWLSASAETIAKLTSAHLNMGLPNQPAAAYGITLLKKIESLRATAMETARQGLDLVDQWVQSTEQVTWTKPQGAGFGCLQLPPSLKDDIAFAETLLNKHNVLVIPGSHFEVPGTLRISWLQAGDQLEEGLDRLGKALNQNQ